MGKKEKEREEAKRTTDSMSSLKTRNLQKAIWILEVTLLPLHTMVEKSLAKKENREE